MGRDRVGTWKTQNKQTRISSWGFWVLFHDSTYKINSTCNPSHAAALCIEPTLDSRELGAWAEPPGTTCKQRCWHNTTPNPKEWWSSGKNGNEQSFLKQDLPRGYSYTPIPSKHPMTLIFNELWLLSLVLPSKHSISTKFLLSSKEVGTICELPQIRTPVSTPCPHWKENCC